MHKKNIVRILLFVTFCVIIIGLFIGYKSISKTFSIDSTIDEYDLKNNKIKQKYISYLKHYVNPEKLNTFILTEKIYTDIFTNETTGKDIIELMKFEGYKALFFSLFDKTRTNFDDCPVTDNFKNKFNTNLLYYYNLNESDDCEVNCSLDDVNKKVTIEVYGNFENTEPTYWNTHHFTYTLDSDGNIDDVIYDYIE